jgi:hypothetical protein
MESKKLLRFTIMDAIDLVLSENGISTPSKKTRKTIIKASEKISNTVQKDLRKSHKQNELKKLEMDRFPLIFQRLEEEVGA